MTRIILEGVEDRTLLLSALSAVMATFTRDEAFTDDEHVFVRGGLDAPTTVEPPAPTKVLHRTSGTPLVPCPRRGRHLRLTECWACWSDVMRGAALEPEVLSSDAWRANPS